jgi:hypothetical protein
MVSFDGFVERECAEIFVENGEILVWTKIEGTFGDVFVVAIRWEKN